jgi:hypothetical protein
MDSEAACEYVCSRGILKRCDVFPGTPRSGTNQLLSYNWNALKPGCTIYISSNSLFVFVTQILPRIPFQFRLVTGDCDLSVPTQVLPAPLIESLLNDGRLVSWWSQNLSLPHRHSKLRPLPIGLDYHTLAEGNHPWGARASPIDQETLLNSIRASAKPLGARQCKLHSNFHFAFDYRQFAFDRRDAMAKIPAELIDYEPVATDRETTWRRQSEYAFVASPMGGGLDCHRTWEALVLGCIPVMRSGPLDPLWVDLPVLLVKDWADLSAELLETTQREFAAKWNTWAWEKLRLDWWMARINSTE